MKKAQGAKHETPGDDAFRNAMRDVQPLRPSNRVEPFRLRAQPPGRRRVQDEEAVLRELARSADLGAGAIGLEDDSAFLRPGLARDILRKLRRTHWRIEDELDVHGMTGDEAALALAAFVAGARHRGLRCVRVIHGKGLRSPGREPMLKRRIRALLTRRDDVLAFVEPRPAHGGGGAVVVLLDG